MAAALVSTGCGPIGEPVPSAAPTAPAPSGVPGFPPLPADAAPNRLLPAVPVTTTGSYAFEHTAADGSPLTYDPCRPIHYVINPAGMPKRGLDMVGSARPCEGWATGLL